MMLCWPCRRQKKVTHAEVSRVNKEKQMSDMTPQRIWRLSKSNRGDLDAMEVVAWSEYNDNPFLFNETQIANRTTSAKSLTVLISKK